MRRTLLFFWLVLCLMPAVLAAAEAEDRAWDVLNHALADGSAIKRAEAITALGQEEKAIRALDGAR